MLVAGYAPPRGSMNDAAHTQCVSGMLDWMSTVLVTAAENARTTPLIFLDANDGFGMHRQAGGEIVHRSDDNVVGPFATGLEHITSRLVLEFAETHDLIIIGTHMHPGGATYFGMHGHRSSPDICLAPRVALQRVHKYRVLPHEHRLLQAIVAADPRDHRPPWLLLGQRLHPQSPSAGFAY